MKKLLLALTLLSSVQTSSPIGSLVRIVQQQALERTVTQIQKGVQVVLIGATIGFLGGACYTFYKIYKERHAFFALNDKINTALTQYQNENDLSKKIPLLARLIRLCKKKLTFMTPDEQAQSQVLINILEEHRLELLERFNRAIISGG